MKPVSLHLENFLSYRQPVDVDFSNLHVACISGQNGSGKSTLLDAITWVLFGKARRTDDALISDGADYARVALIFEYDGNLYQIERIKKRENNGELNFNIRVDQSDGSGRWSTLNEKTVSATEKRIASTLRMEYDTFTNASFFLQGDADRFARSNATERKKILGNILELEIWDSYLKKTADKRKDLENEIERIDDLLGEIDRELGEEDSRKARLAELDRNYAQLSKQKLDTGERLKSVEINHKLKVENRKKLQADEVILEKRINEIDGLAGQLARRLDELAEMRKLLEREPQILAAHREYSGMRARLDDLDRLAASYNSLEKQLNPLQLQLRVTRNRMEHEINSIETRRGEAEKLAGEVPVRQRKFEQLKDGLTALDGDISMLSAVETQLEALKDEKAGLLSSNAQLKKEMDALKERENHLHEVHTAACPTCGQDLSPERRADAIRGIVEQGTALANDHRANQSKIAELEVRIQQAATQLRSIREKDANRQALQREADREETWLSDKNREMEDWVQQAQPRLEALKAQLQAEDYCRAERVQITGLEEQMKGLGYDEAAHRQLREQEQQARGIEADYARLKETGAGVKKQDEIISDLQSRITAGRADIEQQTAGIQAARLNYEELFANLPDLDEIQEEYNQLIEAESSLLNDLSVARQKVTSLDQRKKERKDKEKLREDTAEQVSRYKVLERAFGKKGVPGLLIEQAVPEIEREANDILDRLSAGSMWLSLQTQKDYKNQKREDKQETLEIEISDPSGTRLYEMFSGGEAFRVNFALRLALSRILAQRANARLQTLVIDEGFGSQDSSGRQRLVEAINRVQDDFALVLVITHMEELKDAFQSRIEVEKTGSGSTVKVLA